MQNKTLSMPMARDCAHRIDAKQVAPGKEQVVCGRQLAVEPDVDVDDGHANQLLQAAEVGQPLPPLWHLLFEDIDCNDSNSV